MKIDRKSYFKIRKSTENRISKYENRLKIVFQNTILDESNVKIFAHYIKNGEIPKININSVLLAVNEIERLINYTHQEALKAGLLIKHSHKFKEEIDKLKKQSK